MADWSSTEAALINLALMQAGSTVAVTTADGTTPSTNEARIALAMYGVTRDYVLADLEWPFATQRAVGANVAAGPANSLWAYQCDYPTDCLKVRKVFDPSVTPRRDEPKPFQISLVTSTKKVLTNQANPYLEYTAQITDATKFDEVFKEALVYYLASKFCLALRAKPEMGKGALDAYAQVMKRAADVSGTEGMPETIVSLVDGTLSTQLVLCNKALLRCGYKRMISALAENTDAARFCNAFYGGAVATTLRAFPWNWATRYATLVASGATLPTNWAYAYTLPTDCAKAREISYPGVRVIRQDQRIPFEVAWGTNNVNTLYTNQASDVELQYTTNSITEANFDDIFKDALVWLLASEIGPLLGVDPRMAMAMRQSYHTVLDTAKAASFTEGFEGQVPDCDFLTSRGA